MRRTLRVKKKDTMETENEKMDGDDDDDEETLMNWSWLCVPSAGNKSVKL